MFSLFDEAADHIQLKGWGSLSELPNALLQKDVRHLNDQKKGHQSFVPLFRNQKEAEGWLHNNKPFSWLYTFTLSHYGLRSPCLRFTHTVTRINAKLGSDGRLTLSGWPRNSKKIRQGGRAPLLKFLWRHRPCNYCGSAAALHPWLLYTPQISHLSSLCLSGRPLP